MNKQFFFGVITAIVVLFTGRNLCVFNRKNYQEIPRAFITMLLVCMAFAGCSKGEEIIMMTLSASSFNFTSSGGEQSLAIESNVKSWTIDGDALFWLTITPVSGAGNGTIRLTATQNTGSMGRVATLTVSGTDVTNQNVSVTQDAAPPKTLDQSWRSTVSSAMASNPTQTLTNGYYKGQRTNSARDGLGAYYWNESGDFYFGGWKNSNFEGYGVYITGNFDNSNNISNCPNCKIYAGNYVNGAKVGQGVCYDRTGTPIYSGSFANGSPSEPYPNSPNIAKKFQVFSYGSGRFYLGETVINNFREGYGIALLQDGMWYGPWKNDERNGFGIHINNNGGITVGTWQGDIYNP